MMNVHMADRLEVRDMIIDMKGGVLTDKDYNALTACTAHASHTWLCTDDDKPVAAFGLVPPTILSDRAYLWLYCTELSDHHKFIFVRRSQIVIEELMKLYPTIYGVCEEDNDRAIRWIKRLGAQFSFPHNGAVSFVIEARNG